MTSITTATTTTSATTTTTTAANAERRLRAVLTVNAVTSGIGGVVALALGSLLDELLGTGHPGWVRLAGAGLLLFAIDVALVARSRPGTLRRLAPIVSAGDAAWVVFTIGSIAAGWYSTSGAVAMGVVGFVVAVFGVEQLVLARRMAA